MRKGLRYHHIGIPTTDPREGEEYLEEYKMYTSGFETSPFGVEWLRFEPDSPLPELVKNVAHVAFVVADLQKALEREEVLIQPNSPSAGITVAFVVHNGAPVEFIQFDDPEAEVEPLSRSPGHSASGP
jgi:catechol 2,3-dioxygenase-like lactoylglutathione lyase family enzyme